MTTAHAVPKVRLEWVDTARGIAIVLVALYHSANWASAAGLEVPGWLVANEFLMSLRMPLFFTMAGLFAPKWFRADWRSIWRSKISLYLWVLIVWEVIGSFTFLLGAAMQGECCNVRAIALQVVSAPLLPRFELWFIWALMWYFVLAKLMSRVDFRIQLAITGAIALLALGHLDTFNIGWTKAPQYFFFFLAGAHLKSLIVALGSTRHRKILFAFFLGWAAISVTVTALHLEWIPGVTFVNALAGVLGGLALSRVLTPLRLFTWLGSRTLPIYLAHTPFILVVCAAIAFSPLGVAAGLVTPITVPLIATIAITLALVLNRLPRTKYLYAQPEWLAGLTSPAAALGLQRSKLPLSGGKATTDTPDPH